MKAFPLRPYPWKTFFALLVAGTATSPLVLPYYLGLAAVAPHPPDTPFSLGAMVGLVALRSLVVMSLAAGLGLWVARRLGLGAPYLESWLDGAPRPREPFRSTLGPALACAAGTALLAFAIDGFFRWELGVETPAPEIHARIDVAWWRSGLASLWAPFTEETLDRLFLLSLLAWLLLKTTRIRAEGRGRTAALWIANVVTALFFGVYHIGNEKLFVDPVPTIVAIRTVLIILPVGLAFGWLYWRRGLEAAIVAHFAIDLMVHVVRPLGESWFA